ncbi:hypothetical protein [Siphonobacter sp.]|uniref:hypothetical protein n=1 Tax=Siphonobacter sp. TaxID=1869184 RepID=UPI003B3B7E3C
MFDFRIQPETFQDIDRLSYQIVSLKGKVIDLPFTLDAETFPFTLFIQFIDETGRARSTKNADRPDFLKVLVPAVQAADPSLTPEQATATANAQVNQLIAGLLVGSKPQRYQAAQLLATTYQFTLLPLREQEPVSPLSLS